MTVTIRMDPRWSAMLAMVSVQVSSLADTKQIECSLTISGTLAMGTELLCPVPPAGIGNVRALWTPQPQLLEDVGAAGFFNSLSIVTDNTDTEDMTLDVIIYNFQKDAGRVTPLTVLNQCMPRGTTQNIAPAIV